MKFYLIIFILSIGFVGLAYAGDKIETKLVIEPTAPVFVEKCVLQKNKSFLEFWIDYDNKENQKIVATRWGVISFNLFDELTLSTLHVADKSTKVGDNTTAVFYENARVYPVHQHTHSAIVYLDCVRLEDGTIWRSNPALLYKMVEAKLGFELKWEHHKPINYPEGLDDSAFLSSLEKFTERMTLMMALQGQKVEVEIRQR